MEWVYMNPKAANRIVLIMVDDDEDDCLLVEAALYEACLKCDFHCLQDGADILDYLNRSGRYKDPGTAPRPDIILLDLNLPKMDGRVVLKKLKSDHRFRAIPVIILTTSDLDEDIDFCYETGANTYIVKEASFAGLRATLEVVRDYWLDTATLPPKGDIPARRKDSEPS
jgi:two-component system response regulator